MRVLVLGGIRSGKSEWAEAVVAASVGAECPVRYLATGAVADDDDWSARVAAHRARRPRHWSTVETDDVATQLRSGDASPTLVDDVGGWLTAAMDRAGAWTGGSVCADIDDLLDAVAGFGAELVAGQSRGGSDSGAGNRRRSPVRRRTRHAEPATRGAVRPCGAGGGRPARHGEGAVVTEFPPITAPDQDVAAQARARQDTLTKPRGSLGRLEELSVWVAACQGACPPHQFRAGAGGGVRR